MPQNNIKDAITFVGSVLANQYLFGEPSSDLEMFEAEVRRFGRVIALEHDLEEHLKNHGVIPQYANLKLKSQEQFDALKKWTRERNWSK